MQNYEGGSPPTAVSPAKPQKWNMYALGAAVLASMNSILMGYNIGVMSGAGLYVKGDLKLSDTELEIVCGIVNLYSLVGSAVAGRMSDWIGRRLTIVFAAAVFFVGALTTALATTYAVLMLGRFITGIGVGYALVIAPVYAAEVAPPSTRGFLSSLPEVFINSGLLLAYVSNLAFSGLPPHLSWRVMFAAGCVPPVFLAAGVLCMPESPRWLVMQGHIGEARRVLKRTSYSDEEAELRLSEIQEAATVMPSSGASEPLLEKRSRFEGVWREMFLRPSPQVRRILIAAIGLQFFQQASGVDSVVLYSPRIFEKAGLTSDTLLLTATVVVGVGKTGCVLVATFLTDKAGRRPLLLFSAGGMVASLLVLSTALMAIDGEAAPPKWVAVLCVTAAVALVAAFSVGLGPIAWVYSSEIFPLRLRAQGASLAAATNRIMSAVVSMSFISLYKAITIYGTFYLYAGITAATWVFIYARLPETKGRTLEEMQAIFADGEDDERKKERVDVEC